jgi:hypothetical protein
MHLMEKEDIKHVVEKKVKNVLNILLADPLQQDVKIQAKVLNGAKQNNIYN